MVSNRKYMEQQHNMYVYLRQEHPRWSDKKIHMYMQHIENKSVGRPTSKGEYILVSVCILVMFVFGVVQLMLLT